MALAAQKDDALLQAFVAEYRPMLKPARDALDAFSTSQKTDDLGPARRLFHRVAGIAALVGWPELGTICAMGEDVIVLAERGQAQASPGLLAILRRALMELERVIEAQHARFAAAPSQALTPPPTAPIVRKDEQPDAEPTTRKIAIRPSTESTDISGSRVMVVDDDPLSAKLIELSLKKAGVKIQSCRDPRAALTAIEAARPDLILLDLMMPGQDGFETCRQIRTQANVDQVPIIFITRVSDVNDKVVALELGGDDYITKPFEPNELLARVRTHILKHQAQKEQAFKDALTGAWNRRYYDQRIEQDLKRAQSLGRPLCLAMLDADRFKSVNDVHGHAAGDDVLQEMVARAHATIRASDVVARYGGDEIAVILPDTSLEAAEQVMTRLNQAIKDAPVALRSGGSLSITISVGVTEARADDSLESLKERADQALYQSKRNGRDRVSST